MRLLYVAVGLMLSAGAVACFVLLDPDATPGMRAYRAQYDDVPDMKEIARLTGEELRQDSANAISWADYGEILDNTGDASRAAYAFEWAGKLSETAPQVLLRLVTHYAVSGQPDKAAAAAARVLRITDRYDQDVFGVFSRYPEALPMLTSAVADNDRAIKGLFRTLVGSKKLVEASVVWPRLRDRALVDPPLARSFVEGLLASGEIDRAAATAYEYLERSNGDAEQPFNGGFERPPSGVPFDWTIEKFAGGVASVTEGGHSGRNSLQVRFDGTANLSNIPVDVLARLAPGRYSLHAWIKADDATTNEGLRIEVLDLEQAKRLYATSPSVTGSADWSSVEVPFVVTPETRLVQVRLARTASLHFDSKISGTFWIDDVKIVPTASPVTLKPSSHNERTPARMGVRNTL